MTRKNDYCIKIVVLFLFFCVSGRAQVISYIIPDIGTSRMNTYVEIIGPSDQIGNFGPDSIYLNNPGNSLRVKCANDNDTSKIKIGPLIVSWNGRMISTQIFVMPGQQPNSDDWQKLNSAFRIPIQVVFNGVNSNTDTFYVVTPQQAIVASSAGSIGSGGSWGIRSRRGAMIVESMSLSGNITYSISLSDCDPVTAGEQGYLPFILLSKGAVTLAAGSTLSFNADSIDGGPGGGGGGNGLVCATRGGNGYTGGGGNTLWHSGCAVDNPAGQGTGIGENGLNGIAGGKSSPYNEGGGGGTGHPFGMSGLDGTLGGISTGGYGGGSGGYQLTGTSSGMSGGGGGGGQTTLGSDGGPFTGGNVTGNTQCIPLTGGSGGGGGNCNFGEVNAGLGGGRGGGCLLYSFLNTDLSGTLEAKGGKGEKSILATEGSGGGGSGGSMIIASKLDTKISVVNMNGGIGGSSTFTNVGQEGGNGSPGRLRYDGPLNNTVNIIPDSISKYRGLSTDTSSFIPSTFTIRGTGNGEAIRIYIKPNNGLWKLYSTVSGYSNNIWSDTVTLPCNESPFFLVAAQQVSNPGNQQYVLEPQYIFSQAGANILTTCGEVNCDGSNVHLPNVFSPNNDGKNDTFYFSNDCIKKVTFGIYNRWGTKIYETNDSKISWNGRTSAGKEVPEGTYYYIIAITDNAGKETTKEGFVSLMR